MMLPASSRSSPTPSLVWIRTTSWRPARCRRSRSRCTSRSCASGSPFPRCVLVVEWLHLRTGDPLYRELARRWSKVMLALFAVGVVTGTILCFEMGLLWPGFMSAFGDVFGLGLRARGLFLLRRGDLHRHLRLRMGPPLAATAFPLRHPGRRRGDYRLADGDLGQRVDAEPVRLPARGRPGGRRRAGGGAVRQPVSVAGAHPHVPRRLTSSSGSLWPPRTPWAGSAATAADTSTASDHLRSRSPRWPRRSQIVVGDWIARQVAEDQPTKLAAFEGLGETQRGRADPHRRLVQRAARSSTGSRSPGCCRCSRPTTRTPRCRASTRCPRPSGRR